MSQHHSAVDGTFTPPCRLRVWTEDLHSYTLNLVWSSPHLPVTTLTCQHTYSIYIQLTMPHITDLPTLCSVPVGHCDMQSVPELKIVYSYISTLMFTFTQSQQVLFAPDIDIQSGIMSPKEYEASAAFWFQINHRYGKDKQMWCTLCHPDTSVGCSARPTRTYSSRNSGVQCM